MIVIMISIMMTIIIYYYLLLLFIVIIIVSLYLHASSIRQPKGGEGGREGWIDFVPDMRVDALDGLEF